MLVDSSFWFGVGTSPGSLPSYVLFECQHGDSLVLLTVYRHVINPDSDSPITALECCD
jgi:hypothetical protein